MALRCLLVDDNRQFLALAQRLLESQGIEVVGGASGADEAVVLAGELRPDVVLVDVQLGDENGLELAERLAPSVAVVLISTHPEDELAEVIADSPAVGFLAKRSLSAPAIEALLG